MLVLYIVLFFIAYFLIQQWRKVQQYPPGPYPLPLVGNAFQLGWRVYTNGSLRGALQSFKKDYGPVFTLWIGLDATVHITDHTIAMEEMVTNGHKYADRASIYIGDLIRKGDGLIASNGPKWMELRRFTLHTLRNFGLGRNIMQERIMEEFHLKFSEINKQIESGNKVVDASELFDLLIGSIVNRLLFSTRFSKENAEEFFRLKVDMDKMIENLSFVDLYCCEFLMKVPFLRKRWLNLIKPLGDVVEFARRQVGERIRQIDNGEHILQEDASDYVDAYLFKMKQDQANGTDSYFTEQALAVSLMDLWGAGLETTSTTLNWACTYLLNYPEILNEVREEITFVTGGNRDLSIQDKLKTPLLNAVITETLRLSSIVILNLWRESSEAVKIAGHLLPAKTTLAVQLSVLLTDEEVFKNSQDFNPRRHLQKDNNANNVVAFGLGKRACLGESLARAELYLVLGNLIQYYRISPNGGTPGMENSAPNSVLSRPNKLHFVLEKI